MNFFSSGQPVDLEIDHGPIGHKAPPTFRTRKPLFRGKRAVHPGVQSDRTGRVQIGVVRAGHGGEFEPQVEKAVPEVRLDLTVLHDLQEIDDAVRYIEREPSLLVIPALPHMGVPGDRALVLVAAELRVMVKVVIPSVKRFLDVLADRVAQHGGSWVFDAGHQVSAVMAEPACLTKSILLEILLLRIAHLEQIEYRQPFSRCDLGDGGIHGRRVPQHMDMPIARIPTLQPRAAPEIQGHRRCRGSDGDTTFFDAIFGASTDHQPVVAGRQVHVVLAGGIDKMPVGMGPWVTAVPQASDVVLALEPVVMVQVQRIVSRQCLAAGIGVI